jgi:hypothetical protein
MEGIEDRPWARPPQAALGSLRSPSGCHQLTRIPAAITPVEVRGGSSSADEFEIDIHAAASDVAKQPPVSVNLVKRRILFKDDTRSDWRKGQKRGARGPRVALARPEFRRVDLQQGTRWSFVSVRVSPS